MGELTFAAAILLWGLLPGLLLLWAADVDWSPVERSAGAAGLSLALVACAAYVAEIAGLPIRPVSVCLVILLICAIVFALRRRFAGAPPAERTWSAEFPKPLRWVPWLVWLAPLAVIAQLDAVSSTALLPPPLHDGLDHANWFRLIYDIGSLNPHVLLAPPLSAAGEPIYYPWGMHAWVALVAWTTSLDPVTVLMRALVLVSAAVPLSVYVFTAYFTGRGWTAMAAALLSLVFWWVPYQIWGWGGYPLLAGAIAALPASRLALSSVERQHAASIAAAGTCLAGILFIHPSQLFVALIITALVSLTLAASRVMSWRTALPFLIVFAAAAFALMAGAMVWQPLADFLQRARDVSTISASDPRYRWPIATYFDFQLPLPDAVRIWLGLLAGVGGVAALLNARLRPLLVLHLAFGVLVLLARYQSWVTSLWYHLPERIWYAQVASLPALSAIGIAAAIQVAVRLMRRWIDLSRWQFAVWAVVLWSVFSPLRESFVPWADWRLYHAVHRNPHLSITDRRVLADFAWMRDNIPRGEVIFNAPADWGLPLPFTGHRTVFWSGGYAIDPKTPWNDLLALMRRGDPYTSRAGAELSRLGIEHVYAGRLSPALEAGGRLPLESDALRSSAGFDVIYESETALVLRIADVRATLLGLRDSDRIRFEGFYRLEQDGPREWRWTAGRGLLFINATGQTGRECFVRILGPNPDTFEVWLKGTPLDSTERGYRIRPEQNQEQTLALEVVSGAFTPPPGSPDDRVLGVSVTNIGFACRQ